MYQLELWDEVLLMQESVSCYVAECTFSEDEGVRGIDRVCTRGDYLYIFTQLLRVRQLL